MTRHTFFLAIFTPLFAVSVHAADAPVVREGWDWSLPAHVKPVDYSGYVTWGSKRFDPAITVRGAMVDWARLNPAPGDMAVTMVRVVQRGLE
ncbi:MAG: hypothetical protein GXX96_14885 [Planctomycetaceae bacterium]|nr:hypothetical protein [Planctomycetaceae bacterium]